MFPVPAARRASSRNFLAARRLCIAWLTCAETGKNIVSGDGVDVVSFIFSALKLSLIGDFVKKTAFLIHSMV